MRIPMLLVAAALIAGCGQEAPPVEAAPAEAPVAVPAAAPVAPQAVGDSCSKDCGGGAVVSITCAEGETPVCDCAATPKAACKVPESPAP